MKHVHSKNSIFLLEILLNILLFSILLIVALEFFLKTHHLTEKTNTLHQAVFVCESAACAYENGDGSIDSFMDLYRYSVCSDNWMKIYLNRDFEECGKQTASYNISITVDDPVSSNLSQATITCYNNKGQKLYSLKAYHYEQLRADISSKGVR